MKKILFCLILIAFSVNFVQAQKVNIENTTWKIFAKDGNKWVPYGRVTFLKNGKSEFKNETCPNAPHWKLVGSKLTWDATGCETQIRFWVTIKSNQAVGRGEYGWKAIPIIIRLQKE